MVYTYSQSKTSSGGPPSSFTQFLTLSRPCSAALLFGHLISPGELSVVLGLALVTFWLDPSLLSSPIEVEDTSSGISLAMGRLVLP